MSKSHDKRNSETGSKYEDQELPNEMEVKFEPDGSESMGSLDDLPEIDQLQIKLVDAEKRVLLAHAELENFRRRMRRDMQDQLKFAAMPLMGEMLDAVDNLGRAIDAHQSDANSEGLVQGMKMVLHQISQSLQNHGCKKIEAVGQPFDPNLHQAVQMLPSTDVPPNTVLMDLRSGFMLHDRVIRPSQVAVSAAQPT